MGLSRGVFVCVCVCVCVYLTQAQPQAQFFFMICGVCVCVCVCIIVVSNLCDGRKACGARVMMDTFCASCFAHTHTHTYTRLRTLSCTLVIILFDSLHALQLPNLPVRLQDFFLLCEAQHD